MRASEQVIHWVASLIAAFVISACVGNSDASVVGAPAEPAASAVLAQAGDTGREQGDRSEPPEPADPTVWTRQR